MHTDSDTCQQLCSCFQLLTCRRRFSSSAAMSSISLEVAYCCKSACCALRPLRFIIYQDVDCMLLVELSATCMVMMMVAREIGPVNLAEALQPACAMVRSSTACSKRMTGSPNDRMWLHSAGSKGHVSSSMRAGRARRTCMEDNPRRRAGPQLREKQMRELQAEHFLSAALS